MIEPQSVSGVLCPSRPPQPPPPTAPIPPVITEMIMTATLMPISVRVTVPARPARLPPKGVRAGRWVRRPSATHSGHW
jgi:hypothetical protein